MIATSVRAARLGDADRVAAIAEAGALTCRTRWAVEAELGRAEATLVIAELEEGQIAGYALWWTGVDALELHEIAVAPSRRRQGIGAALLGHLLATARAAAVPTVLLEVHEHNSPALALYEEHGFRPVGRRSGYYADGGSAVLLSWFATGGSTESADLVVSADSAAPVDSAESFGRARLTDPT